MGAICRRPDDRHVQVQKARPSPLAKPNIVSNHSSSQPLAFTTSRTRRPPAVRVDVRHRHVGRCWYRLDVHPGRTVSPNLRSRFRRISTPEKFPQIDAPGGAPTVFVRVIDDLRLTAPACSAVRSPPSGPDWASRPNLRMLLHGSAAFADPGSVATWSQRSLWQGQWQGKII
jgi:hypothetical protein